MKAVRCHSYGDSDVLVYEDADRPVAGPGQVVVKVAGAARTTPEEATQLTNLAADGGTFLRTTPGPVTARDGVRTVQVFVRSDAAELTALVARVDAGALKIHVAQRRPLADLAAVRHEADAGRLAGGPS